MPELDFDLRVVPLADVFPHEEVDPQRVGRLSSRLQAEGMLINPPVVTPAGEQFVLLDGATRVAALARLGYPHVLVQVVESARLRLEHWSHVVRHVSSDELVDRMAQAPAAGLDAGSKDGVCTVYRPSGERLAVRPVEPHSAFAAITGIAETYLGSALVSRTTEDDFDLIRRLYPDLAALVVFGRFSLEDVLRAALNDDRLPAGITRFVVSGRVLHVHLELSLLRSSLATEEKQGDLQRMLEQRVRDGRVRHYPEPVYLLDE